MAAEVVVTRQAAADIEGIADYIAEDDPAAALRFARRLRARCMSLAAFPDRGRPFNTRFRVIVEGDYLIFYRVMRDDRDATVVISLVTHGARDLEALLRDL